MSLLNEFRFGSVTVEETEQIRLYHIAAADSCYGRVNGRYGAVIVKAKKRKLSIHPKKVGSRYGLLRFSHS